MPIIQSKSQLIEYFKNGIKKEDKLLIGVEHEKFLFNGGEKKRVNHKQITKIFKNLETFGWKPIYEKKKYYWSQKRRTTDNHRTRLAV